MAHAHESSSVGKTARVCVITVSTSRSAATDESGPLLSAQLLAAGHTVHRHEVVPDDATRIGECLDDALADDSVDLVLLTGGTGISARDCTPTVVRARLTRELPGFGELFRALSFQEVGSAAMLSDAVGGIAGSRPVFALPGSPKACRLAMERLILPEIGHLLGELRKESPLPEVTARPVGSVAPVVRGSSQRPVAISPVRPVPAAGPSRGQTPTMTIVEVVLLTIGGDLDEGASADPPGSLAQYAGVMDVLNSAGRKAAVRFEDGTVGVAYGYPDLRRPSAKVLVVRSGEPFAEIVVAHRGLQGAGLCAVGAPSGVLPGAEERVAKVSAARTRAAYEGPGQLFAVEGDAVYFVDEGRVYRWDGRNRTPMGTVGQALGSLLLAWSQR